LRGHHPRAQHLQTLLDPALVAEERVRFIVSADRLFRCVRAMGLIVGEFHRNAIMPWPRLGGHGVKTRLSSSGPHATFR